MQNNFEKLLTLCLATETSNVFDVVISRIIKKKNHQEINLINKTLINTSILCNKYKTLLLSLSIVILSNTISKFIRYMTKKKENITINISKIYYPCMSNCLNHLIKLF